MSEAEDMKAAPDQGNAASPVLAAHYLPNSLIAQRQRIASWLLAHGSLTTEQARRDLDVMHPAGRVRDLRGMGFMISTVREAHPTLSGAMHRMARYIYLGHTKEAA